MCERVFSVGFGPGLDSMSPTRSRRSASHAAGTHGWLPKKTGWPGLRRVGIGGYNLHSPPRRLWHTNHVQVVSVWCYNLPSSCPSILVLSHLEKLFPILLLCHTSGLLLIK